MNYRHAFHAGNFADCVKHALLVPLLRALARKPAPFRVLDTHAGIGWYDLEGSEAARTGEWQDGLARVLAGGEAGPLADWLGLIEQLGCPPRYPGSPALTRALLRPEDKLVLCELHPEDNQTLRRAFARDPQVAVHQRDAYEAVTALTPFPEKRGLVLIDPPFEQPGEFERLFTAMAQVNKRMRGAVIAAWYPIKHRAPVRAFHQALADSEIRDVLTAELWLREPTDPRRLNGCGLAVVNPPWGWAEQAEAILAELLARMGRGEPGQGWDVKRICDE
ncbi:23S rRNA (adenine(2030)-N(6))-methyltransferase RlmJ [Acetobacteraceae bacterium H6797]|nr:23S rRNA (adenine(2030)-N(6))-methyltransferase RlmJ [Acetobacteraceae bacterium H6797]